MRGSLGGGMASKCCTSSSLSHPAGAEGTAVATAHGKKKAEAVESSLQGTQQEIDKVI